MRSVGVSCLRYPGMREEDTMTEAATELAQLDVGADCETLARDGIVGLRGALFPAPGSSA